jgi:hypothetical protein
MSIAHMGGKKGEAIVLGMADNEPEDSTSMVHGKMNKSRKMCLKKCKKNHKCNKKCLKRMGSRKKYGEGGGLFDIFGKSNNSNVVAANPVTPATQNNSNIAVDNYASESTNNGVGNPGWWNKFVNDAQKAVKTGSDSFKQTISVGGKKSRRKPRKTRKNKSRRRKY